MKEILTNIFLILCAFYVLSVIRLILFSDFSDIESRLDRISKELSLIRSRLTSQTKNDVKSEKTIEEIIKGNNLEESDEVKELVSFIKKSNEVLND